MPSCPVYTVLMIKCRTSCLLDKRSAELSSLTYVAFLQLTFREQGHERTILLSHLILSILLESSFKRQSKSTNPKFSGKFPLALKTVIIRTKKNAIGAMVCLSVCFNIIFVLFLWEFSIIHPEHTHFPAISYQYPDHHQKSPICLIYTLAAAQPNSQWPVP